MYADFETTGLVHDPQAHVALACWIIDGVRKHSWIQEEGWGRFATDLFACGQLTAHSSFEIEWLIRDGVVTPAQLAKLQLYDTMLAEWVLLGKRDSLKLDDLCKRYQLPGKLPFSALQIKRRVSPYEMHKAVDYCFVDCDRLVPIRAAQEKLLTERGMWHLVEQRNAVSKALACINRDPLYLRKQAVMDRYTEVTEQLQAADDVLGKYDINLNSGKQLAGLLFDTLGFSIPTEKGKPLRTPGGVPKTDEATLSKLVATTEEQQQFIDSYFKRNKLNSLLTKYLRFFYIVCQEHDCKVYGEISQGRTITHRLASAGHPVKDGKKTRGCQLQNIPRELKSLFGTEDEEWVDVDADYAQLEFVGACDLSGDENALYDIVHGDKDEGTDPHSNTARVLTENGEKTTRQDAKSTTFTPLYGGFGKTKAQKKYVEYFKTRYKAIARMQENWKMEVVTSNEKVLITPYGMRFYFPDCSVSSTGYITNSTQIYNYPIQGFSTGEIVPIALYLVWKRLIGCEDWAILENTVHDSLKLRCRKDRLPELVEILKECMLELTVDWLRLKYDYHFSTPLTIEIAAGDYWGDDSYFKEICTYEVQ